MPRWALDTGGRRLAAAWLLVAGPAVAPAVAQEARSLPAPRPLHATVPADRADVAHYQLADLIAAGLARNPELAQAGFAVDEARGRAMQAGLYPNPTIEIVADELGDRQGPQGILALPRVTQEIVTADKLGLDRAAVAREADQAELARRARRYALIADVRAAYFDVLVVQRRIDVLRQVVDLADQSVRQTENLLRAQQVARLDLIQLEVQAERLRAELDATEQALPAAFRRLAAVVGVSDLPPGRVAGTLGADLPAYELDRVRAYVLAVHPDMTAAQIGVKRAQLLLRRATVEPIPNVTVSAAYIRQNQNDSNDYGLSVSMPVPVWDRNQGGIQAARADLGRAIQEVGRVENVLTNRVATAYREFATAVHQAERYREAILPRTEETYELSLKAYQGGQFEYLRVLEAQRTLAEVNLEYLRLLGDAWKAASTLSGLTLEENWPPVPPAEQEPTAEPDAELRECRRARAAGRGDEPGGTPAAAGRGLIRGR